MHFSCIRIFSIVISLASLAVGSFEDLVMTRKIVSADNISLTCASEDDRAALVWNDDLQQNTANKKFSTIWPRHNPECAIVAPNRCIAYWKRSGDWKLVNSFRYPMGPVFDSRWEDFEEYSFSPDFWSYGSVLNCTGFNAIVFSVRGKGTVNMKLCESNNKTLNSCFLITIPNVSLAKFEICIDQVRRSKLHKEYPCYERKVSTKHEELLINESEWRTFSLEWGLQNVSISGNAAIISRAFQNSTRVKYLYVGSLSPGKVRFHNYTYVLIKEEDTKLSTFEFNHTEKSFCIELLVSLCTACELHVRIVDSKGNNQTIGIITGNQYRSAHSNLPTWKVVKLNTTLSKIYENPVKLEILSIMKQSNPDARWAIDSFRKCQPIGTVRSVSSFESVNSNIKCQKLTSTGSSVVKYDAAVTSNNRTDLQEECPRGMNGPFCNVSCTQSECSCAPGYHGVGCNSSDILLNGNSTLTEQYHSLKKGFISLALVSALTICIGLLFICYRKYSGSLRGLRQENLITHPQTLPTFVKWTSDRSSEESPSSLSVVNDAESPVVINTPKTLESNLYSNCVIVKDFEEYVKESIASGLLKSQFKMLPKGQIQPCEYGSLPENKLKNRYLNIIAYDNSRVMLHKVEDDRYSDYINASHVQGFQKERSYIAAQGPNSQTLVDFWRMVWQTESLVICMLANIVEGPKDRERVKCEQYWPEPGDRKTYGDIVVVNENNRVFSNFTFRTFRVTCKEETRIIEHLHYTSWPDHSVPPYPNALISYLKKLHSLPLGNGPIIVHCSAGVGRTGTIILCDICFHQAHAKGTIDVLAEFKKLRDCRLNMVDNELQYIFAHVVLVEWLASLSTEVPCNDTLPQVIEELKKDLPQHIERLHKTAWQDEALLALVSSTPSLPDQLIATYPTRASSSDYSTAVIVDGVRVKKQYVASQLPLHSTLSDFRKLIKDHRIELVIILQRPDPDDPACCNIIPAGEDPMDPVPFLNMEFRKNSDPKESSSIITDKSEVTTETPQVAVLTCPEWGLDKNGKPPPPKTLVKLWIESEKIRRGEGPTLVLCHDGITGCGLYLALSFLLERMTVEQVCDIIFAVRAIRRSRQGFVQSQEQFEYLYEAAAKYVESFETHANFA